MSENSLNQWSRQTQSLNRLSSWVEEYFNDYVMSMSAAGNALPVATDALTNVLRTPNSTLYCTNINAQTLLCPTNAATGLDVSWDATAGDGFDITLQYPWATNTAARFIFGAIGTEKRAFFLEVKATLQDVSGIGEFFFGFRKSEAYAAARATYTDYCGIAIIGAKIESASQVWSAWEILTDSTKTVADWAIFIGRVEVDAAGKVTLKSNYNPATSALVTTGVFYPITLAPDYSFTAALSVVPFIRAIQNTDISTLTVNYLKCGYMN